MSNEGSEDIKFVEKNKKIKFMSWTLFFSISLVVFYAQGRSYLTGYFGYFGLDVSLFSYGVEDIYWYAFFGWLEFFLRSTDFLGDYKNYFKLVRPQLTFLSLAFFIVLFRFKILKFKEFILELNSIKKYKNKLVGFMGKVKDHPVVFGISGCFAILLVLPWVFYIFIVIFFIAVLFVFSFEMVGESVAGKDSGLNFSKLPTVYYYVLLETGQEEIESGSVLRCGENFCAIITQDGRAIAIPTSAVKYVEGKKLSKAEEPTTSQQGVDEETSDASQAAIVE